VVERSIGDGLEPAEARRLFALEARGEGPNSLRDLFAGPERIASLWLTTGGKPHRCARMRDIFEPLGFADELRAALVHSGSCYGYLHLFRSRGAEPFTEADLDLVQSVADRVARALRAFRTEAQRSTIESGAHPELLLLDESGRVVGGSAKAAERIGMPDALAVSSGLAHAVYDLASRAEQGERARVTVRSAESAVELAALPIGALTAIVLEPAASRSPAESAAVFGLTPRERQIAELVLGGHSNRNIALALEISVHTVKDHLKALLAKTRSGSRTELAARLRGQH